MITKKIFDLIELFIESIDLRTYYNRSSAYDALLIQFKKNLSYYNLYGNGLDSSWTYLTETVIPHKAAVYNAGIQLSDSIGIGIGVGVELSEWEWQLLVHDLSKFTESEAAYATHNFKDSSKNTDQQNIDFALAWHHHKINNPHHPEYWISVGKSGETEFMVMPREYIAEMIADWIGAGQTYGNNLEDWLPENLPRFYFHSETAKVLDEMLGQLGFRVTEITRVRKNVTSLSIK